MPDTNSIQLQSVGDLISESIRICLHNYMLIIKVLLPVLIPTVIARTCLLWGFTHLTETFFNALAIGSIGFCFSIWFSWLVLLRLLTLLNVLVLQEENLSESKLDGFNRVYKEIKNRQLSILGIFGVTVLAEIIAFIASIVGLIALGIALSLVIGKTPAIAIIAIAGASFLIFGATLFNQFMGVGLAMLSIERRSFSDCLDESLHLITKDPIRAFGFAVLLLFSIYLLAIPLNFPITAYSFFIALSHSFTHTTMSPQNLMSNMPLSGLIFTEAWAGLTGIIMWSITCIAYGVYYKDLTVRQYAADLTRQVEALTANKV